MIKIDGLTKEFDGKIAVDNLSFTVPTGKICTLVGTSGCGKSTTLRLINRLITPTSGFITINDEDVTHIPETLLRRRIGYAIQGIGLFPHRTIYQNIATVPKLLGWSRQQIDARVTELCALFQLDVAEYGPKYPRQLSGGQQQRVGVARAIAGRPELLLMDEPFGALDPLTRRHLQDELLLIQRQLGITIIMVTHDMEEALRMADMIAVMDQGKLLQISTPRDLLKSPHEGYVASLIGSLDRSLRLLALTPVIQLMRPTGSNPKLVADLPTIPAHANLRDALNQLIWTKRQNLPVYDDQDRLMGYIHLNDVLQHGGQQLEESHRHG